MFSLETINYVSNQVNCNLTQAYSLLCSLNLISPIIVKELEFLAEKKQSNDGG